MVGNARVGTPKREKCCAKAFRDAIGQMKNFANNELCFDSGVAINERAASAIIVIRMIPGFQDVIAKPERNIAAIH